MFNKYVDLQQDILKSALNAKYEGHIFEIKKVNFD